MEIERKFLVNDKINDIDLSQYEKEEISQYYLLRCPELRVRKSGEKVENRCFIQGDAAIIDTWFAEKEVDVITYHQNQDFVVSEADKNGVYSIGYHIISKDMSSKYLTSVVCNWQILYEEIMKQYLQGNANSEENYWIGLDKGAVDLTVFSSEVSSEILEELEKAKGEILEGRDVFSGLIYDNTGVLRCDEGEIIRDKTLLEQFDWFVEGVEIYEE